MTKLVRNIVALVLALIVGTGVGVWASTDIREALGLDSVTESNNTKVITAIERQEQVVLLSTSTQGLAEERAQTNWLGRNIYGTGRTQFVQYNYRAKLGIEARDVTIEEKGDNQFLISIPAFIFIGHDNVQFKTAIENNGVISWITPEIDTSEMISRILSEDATNAQIDENRGLLQEQAKSFYSGIVRGVSREAELEFEFR
ncbi:hypothetical protein CATRI_00970 [Corynebacterium atrinae]|uniref:hypothetical protein n=1 Tax=Corynebacterium atrinae TaxID=1336740 RepID=UPI0025B54CB3|nr:hypothetical protein [Corynebacterium atrinae]WJY62311.1 hypothetical protein CATRI_00970 [Corynebacterium atrinae]